MESADSVDVGEQVIEVDTTARSVHVADLEYGRLPSGDRILSGRVVNPTDRHLRNVQVQVSLYDEDNRSIGTMMISIQDVEPDGERAFSESVDEEGAAGARVRGIMAQ